VRTTAGAYEFDSLVLATGFDAMTGALLGNRHQGQGDVSLRQKWQDGPDTYLGLAVSGFPNLFTINRPGSPSVLSNMVVSIEQHVDWISDLVDHMATHNRSVVEAVDTAEKEWTDHVREVGDMTLFPQSGFLLHRRQCSRQGTGSHAVPRRSRGLSAEVRGGTRTTDTRDSSCDEGDPARPARRRACAAPPVRPDRRRDLRDPNLDPAGGHESRNAEMPRNAVDVRLGHG
jgi:hypothetical protein